MALRFFSATMPTSAPLSAAQVRVTGKQYPPEYFRIVERAEFDPADVVRVLRGEIAGVIFRGAISAGTCEQVKKNFWANPMLRKRGDAVPAYYLGTYHYAKELELYLQEAEDTRAALGQVFQGAENFYARIMDAVAANLRAQGVTMRVAEHGGRHAGEFVMRSWSASGKFALAAHDDGAQLTARKQAGFEIQRVLAHPLTAVNLCLENGEGGELVYWNLEPDNATRRALGVEETGHPYAAELLTDFPHIDLAIRTGDAYFFNGKLVHGVRAQANPEAFRSTISLLMGFLDPQTVIYWT
jgi:hypothetical protein